MNLIQMFERYTARNESVRSTVLLQICESQTLCSSITLMCAFVLSEIVTSGEEAFASFDWALIRFFLCV